MVLTINFTDLEFPRLPTIATYSNLDNKPETIIKILGKLPNTAQINYLEIRQEM